MGKTTKKPDSLTIQEVEGNVSKLVKSAQVYNSQGLKVVVLNP